MYNELLVELMEVLYDLDCNNDNDNCRSVTMNLLSCLDFDTLPNQLDDLVYFTALKDTYDSFGFAKSDDVYLCSVLEDASELLADNNWRGDLRDSIKTVIDNFESEWSDET